MPAQCCKEFWNRVVADPDDPPVFTLVAYDNLAIQRVADWIDRAKLADVNSDKVQRAQDHLDAMKQWRLRHPERCKIPD